MGVEKGYKYSRPIPNRGIKQNQEIVCDKCEGKRFTLELIPKTSGALLSCYDCFNLMLVHKDTIKEA